jgi:hypothetical protein
VPDGPHLTMVAAVALVLVEMLASELSGRDKALVLGDAERQRRAREMHQGDGADR